MCHLILGDTKCILTMFVRKKKYPSGNIGVIVVEKIGGKMKELATIGVAYNEDEVENLVYEAKEWISKEESRRHPQLDLYGEEREACDREREEVRRVLSQVSNILLNGCDLILDRTFDRIGFNRIDDEVFRKLVKARLAYPTSKAATVEYLKNHFDEDVDLSKIYRYLDKLSDHQHEIVQDISVRHTAKLFGGNIGVLFYDVTTLYFEADYEDDLRKTGFSKEGRHSNPQITLGVSDAVIGLTIVAGGTSLPELATSMVSAKKGNSDIAIGNVIGSNVFNILMIIGVTGLVKPMHIKGITLLDLIVMLASMLLLWFFCRTTYKVKRWEGAVLAISYIAYLAWLIAQAV